MEGAPNGHQIRVAMHTYEYLDLNLRGNTSFYDFIPTAVLWEVGQ